MKSGVGEARTLGLVPVDPEPESQSCQLTATMDPNFLPVVVPGLSLPPLQETPGPGLQGQLGAAPAEGLGGSHHQELPQEY